MKKYDVAIVGAGPGGIYAAYELMKKNSKLSVVVLEAGHSLEKRHCPIDGKKIKSCISCKSCSIMSGFGGAGAFSDGKYNITNDFGGTLYEYIGKEEALSLMRYVDEINMENGGEGTRLFSTAGTKFKKLCMLPFVTLEQTSITWFWKIFMPSLRIRWNSILIVRWRRWKSWRMMASISIPRKKISMRINALFL